jgi:hypothetical protein
MVREKLSRSPEEHSAALAAANAPVLRQAARALIRGCSALDLVHSAASDGHVEQNGEAGRIAALLCFDEVQVSDPFTVSSMQRALITLALPVTGVKIRPR